MEIHSVLNSLMMKKKIYLFLLLSTAVGTMQGRWLSEKHNFGAFDEDMGPVTCEFVYINDTAEPVAITQARSSCGCTQPRYSRDPIAPGDSASILVTYDPQGRPGKFSKNVGVDLSTGERKKLLIYGTVVGSPQSLQGRYPYECCGSLRLSKDVVMMGEIKKGQLKTVFQEGYNHSTDTIYPRVNSLPDYVSVSVSPEKVAPGEQFSFIYYFNSARCELYGLVSDTAKVELPSGEGCPISIIALVKEDFDKLSDKDFAKAPIARLETMSLDLGRVSRSGGMISGDCLLKNEGKNPLKIRRVYTGDSGISVTADKKEIKSGKTAVIRVEIDPSMLRGALLNGRISVITNDPSSPVQTLRVVGELEP